MKFWLIFMITILPATYGKNLFEFLGEESSRQISKCSQELYLSCEKVELDIESLTKDEVIYLPMGLELSRTQISKAIHDNSVSYTFKNEEEGAEVIFVHGENNIVVGSLNWAKEGRYFMLEKCSNHLSCYTWSEINTQLWVDEVMEEDAEFVESELTDREQSLLDLGRQDTTTVANVSLTIYTSETFRKSFASDDELKAFVNLGFAETNQGYANSKIPLNVYLKCLLNSASTDGATGTLTIKGFKAASGGDFTSFRKTADIALLFTSSYTDICGNAYFNTFSSGATIGTLSKNCITGYYSFGHEVGHIVGAMHNRETGGINKPYPTAYGYLMRPPVESGYRSILAYTADGYDKRVNYYSSPGLTFQSIPTGTAEDDNAKLLMERRFLMAAVGDESMGC